MEKLWGDNFFDPSTKKWTKKSTGAPGCKRGFVQFIYDPIKSIIEACMNDNKVPATLARFCGACITHVARHVVPVPPPIGTSRCIVTWCPWRTFATGQYVNPPNRGPACVLVSCTQRGLCVSESSPLTIACLRVLPQEKLFGMTDKLGITPKLKSEDKDLTGKALMKRIMQAWLPAHEVRRPRCCWQLPP